MTGVPKGLRTAEAVAARLRDCERKLADAQSEVTWWRERMRELAEEWRTRAALVEANAGHQPLTEHGRHQQTLMYGISRARAACARELACIVAEAETGRNGTATPGGHDGTTTS